MLCQERYCKKYKRLLSVNNIFKAEQIRNTKLVKGVNKMSKKGMKRPEVTHTQPRNTAAAVPEIQGKAKHGKAHVNPIIAGTESPAMKVYHSKPFSSEKPISKAYPVIDNDLARDNLENDLTAADIQDLQ